MYQKITNISVGLIALFVISSAIYTLINVRYKDALANNSTTVSTESFDNITNVLGDSTSNSELTVQVLEEARLPNNKTTFKIYAKLTNTSPETIQFSPPIDMSVLDTVSNNAYSLDVSEKTTLFGGPINAGKMLEGFIYVTTNQIRTHSDLIFLYQPNYSSTTLFSKL